MDMAHEKLTLLWTRVKFHDFPQISTNFVLFAQIFYLPVVGNDTIAFLVPNCSSQLLIRDIISHHPVISMWQCVIDGVCYFHFHIFNYMLVSKVLDKKVQKRYIEYLRKALDG